MKIAITSQNFRTITAHAGKSRRFLVFSPNEQGEWEELERLDLPKEMSIHEFRGLDHPLFHYDILVSASAGQGFIRRLAQHNVKVVLTSETNPYEAVLALSAGNPLPPPQEHDHHHSN
jgi:predicted Fe-Mo cluster-binding NifX family protein